jgi:tetratricopeptide (TPR) repeat protein
VRLQHVVGATRRVIEAERGRLPPGARVAYWGLPHASGLGFQDRLAVRVWLRDSAATFAAFGGPRGFEHLPDLVIAYDRTGARAPVKVSRRALETYALALEAASTPDRARTDSLYARALLAQSPEAAPMSVAALRNRALIALSDGRVADARRFASAAARLDGTTADGIALEGCVALSEGRTAEAERSLREALRRDPGNGIAAQGLANLARVTAAAPQR